MEKEKFFWVKLFPFMILGDSFKEKKKSFKKRGKNSCLIIPE
jgi:hypothetical protein